jgi:hypothetical protein
LLLLLFLLLGSLLFCDNNALLRQLLLLLVRWRREGGGVDRAGMDGSFAAVSGLMGNVRLEDGAGAGASLVRRPRPRFWREWTAME